jgi:hypothetical protein
MAAPAADAAVAPVASSEPVVAAEPVVVIEPVAPARAFPDEPDVDTSWNNPKAVHLFLLAGYGQVRLTHPRGLSVEYTVKQVPRTNRKARKTWTVLVPEIQRPIGTIDEHEQFAADDKLARRPESMLFARWYADISEHRKSKIAAKHLGKCGCCARGLAGAISLASGICPDHHFDVFGVHRSVATSTTPRTPGLPKTAEVPYVHISRGPECFSALMCIFKLSSARARMKAVTADGDTEEMKHLGEIVRLHQTRLCELNPSIEDIRAIAADHASYAANKRSLRWKYYTPDWLAGLDEEIAKYEEASRYATALADRLEARAAATAPAT